MIREILHEIKEIESNPKKLREFALTIGSVLAIIGGIAWWHQKSHGPFLVSAAVLISIVGYAVPTVLRPFQKVWMALALILGWVMSRVILCILFFAILTPISLLLRVIGKPLLDTKWKEKKDTFWLNHAINENKQVYERQF